MDKLIKRIKYSLMLLSLFLLAITTYKVDASTDIVLTYSDSGIEETVAGEGYKINGTTLTISSSGTYRIKGTCSEGNIEVKREVTDVTLFFDNLSLTSSKTAPLIIGRDGADVNIKLIGHSQLIDNEDPANEFSTDIEVSSLFEGATIKIKSDSFLTISGSGKLDIVNTSNNGIKGGERASLTINSGTLNINAANSGISCDGPITINKGNITIDAFFEGIKISPDELESMVDANLTINGGKIVIDSGEDGIQTVGNVYINNDADITVNSLEDAIQVRKNFYMTNGKLNLYTYEGYTSTSFNKDLMSAKGIKTSPKDDELVVGATNVLSITGGTVTINSSDDSIHSNGRVIITGGTFNLQTTDDAVHADSDLTIGVEDGLERDPEITVPNSYEGLEGGNVYIYSGKIKINAIDDGINAAGGSSSDTGGSGVDNFNPSGGAENFAMYIYGGEIYVNAEADGLDSNGSIYLYGGNIVVYQEDSNGGNSALDRDSDLIIDGATFFSAGGVAPSGIVTSIGSNQNYILAESPTYAANTKIAIMDGGNRVFNDTIPKSSNYTFYTSPTLSNTATIEVVSSIDTEFSHPFNHNFDDGVVTTTATENNPGIITYTCLDHNETERKTYFYTEELTYSVHNKTNGIANVSLGGAFSSEDFTTHTTTGVLTVVSSESTVVSVAIIGGSEFQELSADTVVGNTYTFNIEKDISQDIYVVLVGDVNMDGTVNNSDAELIKKSKLSLTNENYRELSILESIIADMDQNGVVNIHDALLIENPNLTETDESDKYILENNGTVMLDGENDGTVIIDFIADANLIIDAIEANFIPSNDNPNLNVFFTLTGIEEIITGGDETHDVQNGLIYMLNQGGYSVSKGDVLYRATFKVDKDTPTGSYPVKLNVVTSTLHESNVQSSFILTNMIIVKGINDPLMATFETDEGVDSIDFYYSDDYTTPDETDVSVASVRDGDTGVIDMSGNGQVNFRVNLKPGYIISSITVSPTESYKNLKGPADTKALNTYRITKVSSDIEVIITTKVATEYTATFVKNTGIKKVDVYYTQDYTTPSVTDVNETEVRDGGTGEIDMSGDGQVNFKVTPKKGYKIGSIDITGSYKNLKDQGNGIYRITKVNGDLMITINAIQKDTITLDVSGVENSYSYTGSSITPAPIVKIHGTTTELVEGTDYTVIYGDNNEVGTNSGTISIKPVDSSDYFFDDVVLTFDIEEFELTISNVIAPSAIVYTGETLVPNVEVKANNQTLVEGTDYDISYNNLDGIIGEYVTVTVTGKGNYTGIVDNINILISDKFIQTLTFDETNVTKTYGEDYTMTASHTVGDGEVTYESSNPDVATVDNNGNVTLLKSGNTTIYARASETANYEAQETSYLLTVNKAPLEIVDAHVSNKNYDGTTDATIITVTLDETVNSDTLVKGTDFTATGEFSDEEIGVDKDVTVSVTLSEETSKKYSLSNSSFTAKARITLEEITSTDVTLEEDTYTYNGSAKEPNVTVVVSGTTLVKDQDYNVEYEDNINAGTARVIITGLNNYITDDPIIKTFTINKKSITPTIEAIDDVEYTGSELTPSLTVKDGSVELTENDYSAVYTNNVNVGEGSVIISQKANGNYIFDNTLPNCTKTFTIVPYELKEEDITLEYYFIKRDGTSKEPGVTVVANSNELEQDTDYRVEYSNNIEAGTNATVKVIAMSANYTGSPEVHFEISLKDILTISGINDDQSITYTGSPVELSGNLTVSNNTDNITKNDLTTTWYSEGGTVIERPINVGKYYVIYSYDGDNYKGSLKVNFEITKKTSKNPSELTSGLTGLTDATLSTVTLSSAGLSWDNLSTIIEEGNHSYPATYTQNNDTENYTTINVSIPVKGLKMININTSVSGSGGTISSSLTNVVEGNQKTITFAPNTGYEIDKVEVNGSVVNVTNNKLILTAGKNDLNVVVTYKTIRLKLTITGTYVDLNESGIITIDYGSDRSITISPKSGYDLESVTVNDIEMIDSLTGNTLELTNIIENTKVIIKAKKSVHDVIDGDGQTYKIDKDSFASFKVDAELSLFNPGGKIYVDNELVNSDNYTVEEGIIITFKKEFLDELSTGTHGLKLEFNNESTATATFKIVKDVKPASNPKTNDNIMDNLFLLIISVLSLLSMIFFVKMKKYEKN